MPIKKLLLFIFFSVLASMLGVTPLKFAHYANSGDTAYAAAEKFKELVEKSSNGNLQIILYPSGSLGNSPVMLQGARLGTIDIVLTGNPYFTSFAPEINILDLPFLFSSEKHAYAVLDGEVGDELLNGKGLVKSGLKGLAFWEIGFRNVTNSKRPIQDVADFKGLKIRTTPNPAHILTFKILGANPTPMPFAEVYSALQTHTIDGQENPVNHIYASKLYEVQKYLSLTRHAYTASPLVMNAAKFNRLSKADQKILLQAAKDAAVFERALNSRENDESLAAMEAEGVVVNKTPNRAAMQALVQDKVRADYVKKFGDRLLKKIDSLRQ